MQASGSRAWFFDEQVAALAVLVTESGSKSFYMVKKHKSQKIRIRIGSTHEVPLHRARQLASELVLEVMSGQYEQKRRRGAKNTLTLQTTFEEYMTYARAHLKGRTVFKYENQWSNHLSSWGGKRLLKDIRRAEITKLHLRLGEISGHYQANRVIALLRAVFNRAIREHELDIPNPASGIRLFREHSRSRRLEPEELPRFFQALADEPNSNIRDFILLSLFTGARKSNLLQMRWDEVQLDRGLWVVRAEESKSNTELPIVLSDRVIQILRDRKRHASGLFVFPGVRGVDHMTNPNKGWERILKRAGLENLRMHDLRRSLASFQIDTGTPLEVIQKTLGHGNKSTTEIYARMALEPVRASLEVAIGEMLKQAGTGGK